MTLALQYAVRSDVGLLREGNEDAAYAGPHMLAVADGMGGHAAGEIASAVAIEEVSRLDGEMPVSELLNVLAKTVAGANHRLHEMVTANPAIGGMGTTLIATLWSGSRFALCHIGDSRAYLLRDGDLFQITHDHTLVQSLIDDGRITPDEAATHPQRSLLLRALDGSPDAEPDLDLREAREGDRYLLCSDGLSGVVSEETLHATLANVAQLDEAVLQLTELAIKGGGPDNITTIVADVVDSALGALPPSSTPVFAGAASNSGAGTLLRTDSPAGRAHAITQTQPQPAIAVDHDDPAPAPRAARSGRGAPRARRRWPIVTSVLILLLALIIGGTYAAWRYTQGQYYVGAVNGQVTIFRGVNQNVAGISLSHVYRPTGIPLAEVPMSDQSSILGTISASGLAGAMQIVGTIRTDYQRCHNAYLAQAAYKHQLSTYHTRLAAYKKRYHTVKPVRSHHKTVATPPKAPKQPVPIPSDCPAAPASVAGAGGSS
jgi:protein phosphatase